MMIGNIPDFIVDEMCVKVNGCPAAAAEVGVLLRSANGHIVHQKSLVFNFLREVGAR